MVREGIGFESEEERERREGRKGGREESDGEEMKGKKMQREPERIHESRMVRGESPRRML